MTSNQKTRGRRSFLRGSCAALSVSLIPAAAGAAAISPAQADSGDAAAIRKLYRDYAARRPVGQAVLLRLLHDPAQPRDTITFAADRQSASAVFHCVAQIEAPLVGDAPLLEMARMQGNSDRSWQTGVHELDCVKAADGWKIRRVNYRAAGPVS